MCPCFCKNTSIHQAGGIVEPAHLQQSQLGARPLHLGAQRTRLGPRRTHVGLADRPQRDKVGRARSLQGAVRGGSVGGRGQQ